MSLIKTFLAVIKIQHCDAHTQKNQMLFLAYTIKLEPSKRFECFKSKSSMPLMAVHLQRAVFFRAVLHSSSGKFFLQRQTAEPLTHSAVSGREQTILLTSGGQ